MGNTIVVTDESLPLISSKRKKDDRPRERYTRDAITEAIECTYFILDRRFDFFRVPFLDRGGNDMGDGDRMVFKRFYPEKNILIDLINADNDKIRKLVSQKCEVILKYNKTQPDEKKFGYLPLLATQRIPKATFDKVAAHRVLNLPPRSPQLTAQMKEQAIYIQAEL